MGDGEAPIGAVFSIRSPLDRYRQCDDFDMIVKVTEYVEKSLHDKSMNHYVVFESEKQNLAVTEMLKDGTVTWRSNPEDLEGRNSCAKVIRSSDCSKAGITIADMKRYQEEIDRCECVTAHSERKHYVQTAYGRACGEQKRESGFMVKSRQRWFVGNGGWERTDAKKDHQLKRSEKDPSENYDKAKCRELGEMMRF